MDRDRPVPRRPLRLRIQRRHRLLPRRLQRRPPCRRHHVALPGRRPRRPRPHPRGRPRHGLDAGQPHRAR
ncbi:MAG: hypothetical protein F4Y54_05545 [Dehalococcoidia bacterium]|nr:hypothetical protein [Dehalococcoidia bacterium]